MVEADKERKSPLHLACQHGHLEVVRCLLGSQQDILEACDNKENTPLHFACLGESSDIVNRLNIVNLLISNGANWNATNKEKRSPVHNAAESGFVTILKVLVHKQRDLIKSRDCCKRTPLHLAAKYNKEEVIQFLHE